MKSKILSVLIPNAALAVAFALTLGACSGDDGARGPQARRVIPVDLVPRVPPAPMATRATPASTETPVSAKEPCTARSRTASPRRVFRV